MRWDITNTHVQVWNETPEQRDWLLEFLHYTDREYNPYKKTWKETRVHLFDRVTSRFPCGFARPTYTAAKDLQYEIEIRDMRTCPCEQDSNADLEWLKHHPAVQGEITHQVDAVHAVCKHKRGILWVATGGGKTDIAVGLTRALPCRWVFLVHRADLLQQTADRYNLRTGLEAGRIGDGHFDVPKDCKFIVCTLQTVHRAFKSKRREVTDLIESADGVIADECHVIPASTAHNVIMRATNAYYRVGLSGTPLSRGDGRNMLLIGAIGPVIYRVDPGALIDVGLLAKPKITMTKICEPSRADVWRRVYQRSIVESQVRNGLVAHLVKRATKPCLVFVQHIEHGKTIMELLQQQGLRAEFVWGKDPTPVRQAAVKRLVRNECDVLVCNVIFQEGVDIPSLQSVVIASAGKSIIATLQRIGRGMRADVNTGKTEFEVWDIFDNGCGCDKTELQHQGCKWLLKHSRARRSAYKREGYTVMMEDHAQQNLSLDR